MPEMDEPPIGMIFYCAFYPILTQILPIDHLAIA